MRIDVAIEELQRQIITLTEHGNINKQTQSLEKAVEVMRKYQKIQKIVNSKTTRLSYELGFRQIRKVLEDGNDD